MRLTKNIFVWHLALFVAFAACSKKQEPPSSSQVPVKQEAKPVEPEVVEPWIETPELVAQGAKLYKTNCAFCHGKEGKGDGMAGKNLKPPPRDIVEGNWKFGGDRASMFKLLTEGSKGTSMAAYGHLPATQRWSLVHFMRSISKNKVTDEAKLKAFLQDMDNNKR